MVEVLTSEPATDSPGLACPVAAGAAQNGCTITMTTITTSSSVGTSFAIR